LRWDLNLTTFGPLNRFCGVKEHFFSTLQSSSK
jgi:hypothetical protein